MKKGRLKEAVVAERDSAPEDTRSSSDRLIASTAFPALVALWFAALFGAGFLFLPQALFDALFGGIALFGEQTRVVVALGAAGLGLLLGLFIANRVRSEQPADIAPAKPRQRTREARAPLDVRAALGLAPDPDDDDDRASVTRADTPEDDAFELSDEHVDADDENDDATADLKAPIDDPHFASAWSDADAPETLPGKSDGMHPDFEIAPARQARDPFALLGGDDSTVPNRGGAGFDADWEADWGETPSEPAPRPKPSRYNPFADHLPADDEPEPRRDLPRAPAPQATEPSWGDDSSENEPPVPPRPNAAPPPPPVWPEPRAQEPELSDLGVAELVERLARALQREGEMQREAEQQKRGPSHTRAAPPDVAPRRSGEHRHDSALAPANRPAANVDQALRSALDRLSRLDDVA